MTDFDKYYTPTNVATQLIGMAPDLSDVRSVIDPACGNGSLLEAANARWKSLIVRGLDLDSRVISSLKKQRAEWDVFVGSVYPTMSIPGQWLQGAHHDIIIANPPFSMGRRRFVELHIDNHIFRCSLAMAYIAASIHVLNPKHGALAVMPESSMYSELDSSIRKYLAKRFEVRLGSEIQNTTFQGARARSVLCAWLRSDLKRGATASTPSLASSRYPTSFPVCVVRGGIQVFRVVRKRRGVPFIHSTDLSHISRDPHFRMQVIAPVNGIHIEGSVVLISRVGEPRKEQVAALHLATPTVLSDCVLALHVRSRSQARELRKFILSQWAEFSALYRGTAARFVTVARISDWLHASGFPAAERASIQPGTKHVAS